MNEEVPSPPLVSIGIPVYNEDRFLEESLQSLLSQDYRNLEIIISDNASTDKTEAICRKYCNRDHRIRYHRFESNQGATANFRKVVELAQGRYFMWAAGHDLWSPNLISECASILEKNPDGVIAFGSCTWIDAAGRQMARASGWTDTRGMDPIARFFSVFWGNMHPILGVMRIDALRQARFQACIGTDLLMLSELALMGHFIHASSASWSRREFRDDESYRDRMKRYRSSQYRLSHSLIDRFFPVVRLPLELIKVALRARVPWFEKLGIVGILVPSLPVKYVIGRRGRSA
ncbi:MAG: glycosyltransferase family 2 protein [Sulfuricaulis sp.]|uniref:glycosyltransferase family 2 protein n=1 Tax=Sulfuricaulis sp. TaxID=2003553 RepID=UPI0025CCF85E|nr:glycosyltransferase family 2 protein [Sulfuricaulis sp.]MCR4346776.1 glycosyltransferase family 2 protein [Sulfuricaulis sp.]